jgi:hypothetical protein
MLLSSLLAATSLTAPRTWNPHETHLKYTDAVCCSEWAELPPWLLLQLTCSAWLSHTACTCCLDSRRIAELRTKICSACISQCCARIGYN